MSGHAFDSPAKRALYFLSASPGAQLRRDTARDAIDTVFRQLNEPDSEMVTAGADALARALAGGISKQAAKRLAEDVWRAMLDRAR